MFNILITEDVINDKIYFSKNIGDKFKVDPAKKYQNTKLEDGSMSVTTKLFKGFGTKASMIDFWNTIDDVLKFEIEEKVFVEKEVKPEVELVKKVAEDLKTETAEVTEEDGEIVLPEPIVKKDTKKK